MKECDLYRKKKGCLDSQDRLLEVTQISVAGGVRRPCGGERRTDFTFGMTWVGTTPLPAILSFCQQMWIECLLGARCCVTFGESLNISEPLFLPLQNGDMVLPTFLESYRSIEVRDIKHPALEPGLGGWLGLFTDVLVVEMRVSLP